MKDKMVEPCPQWAEKLAALHQDDLSSNDRIALDEHVASCPACSAVRAEYHTMRAFIHDLHVPGFPSKLPPRLLQLWENQGNNHGGLLIVDSDCDLVEMMASWLKTLGYKVHRAYTVEQAKSEWIEQRPDLVILDSALGDGDSLAMCQAMRVIHDALVLVVTDGKDVRDEVRCLQSGADDYLRKPFFPSQLLARIQAMGRRTRSTLKQHSSSIVTVGPIRVDALYNEVSIHGKTSHLTGTESKLLHFLATNANDVCTSEQIVTHIWGYGGDGDVGLIKAHIRHLRQKIEPDPGKPHYILTVPGVGYTLVRRSAEEREAKEEGWDVLRSLRSVSS
ncbi:MAG: winged helix-turn-helix domain-containing protein [Ktedonobacteraceae bacterium]